jgi:phenylalanyl-tRNA synthetase beta chain
VRFAAKEEVLTLLNGQTVKLDDHILVIADNNKALAMAGVMGGVESSVHAETVDLLLESAFFQPSVIAGVARRFGFTSEASQRFERGVDPTLHLQALERAAALLLEVVGGQVASVNAIRIQETFPPARQIHFRPARVAALTGVDISEETMHHILKGLGMLIQTSSPAWVVDVPFHRFDLTLEVDLIEEILRVYGYDKLHATPVIAPLTPGKMHAISERAIQISSYLSARGYTETISYSFVDPTVQREIYTQDDVLSLLNPISSELSEMRVGLWPGLVASLMHNMHRQQNSVKCFETGVVFKQVNGCLEEHAVIGGILSGESGYLHWAEAARNYDFYDMKGDLEALFMHLHCDASSVSFVPDTHVALHPGQTARICLRGETIGWLGVLHPRLLDMFGLTRDVVVFEFALKPLLAIKPIHYQRISKYPRIRRDLSLLMDTSVNICHVEQIVRAVVPVAQLKAFNVFDQYMGDSLPEGKKSIAIALTLQDEHRTLVDDEINRIISAILKELYDQLAIVLRD